ncbi:hypothetical protein PHMEG_00016479 [Phytophthora megakarya]|uniref:Uncharacterized protein n=1 Tax=Phytophthora megakarya TaxID=4795 RepID=A0A225VZ89_9STRA|nr:hypothetical protein PHMEG_00016479 [Phytophthora megakarya]
MVGMTCKIPRHQLTELERLLCLDALQGGRRDRLINEKKHQEKTPKLTTSAMEVALSKHTTPVKERGASAQPAEEKVTKPRQAVLEAKDTVEDDETATEFVSTVADIVDDMVTW